MSSIYRHTVLEYRNANDERKAALRYLRAKGLQVRHAAHMRDVSMVEVMLAGYDRKPRNGKDEKTAIKNNSLRILGERNASYMEAMLFAQSYIACDFGAANSPLVCPVAMATVWRDFQAGWPNSRLTVRHAAKIAHCLLQGVLCIGTCKSCSMPQFQVLTDLIPTHAGQFGDLSDLEVLMKKCPFCLVKHKLTSSRREASRATAQVVAIDGKAFDGELSAVG